MHLQIRHVTRYDYTKAVFCEPLTVRLHPRHDVSQRVDSFQLQVTPVPASITPGLDMHDNTAAIVRFQGLASTLIITSEAVVETLRINPFDFQLAGEALMLPFQAEGPREPLLEYYARPEAEMQGVRQLADEVLGEVDRETIGFVCLLADRICNECEAVERGQGAAQPAEKTWLLRGGDCRDLAVLFNEACRAVGLPARFVSGYALGEVGEPEQRHLHAWSEVYLPGAGWRGFDATTGQAVADEHVAVAIGRLPHHAAATYGTFRGTGVTSSIETQIVVRSLAEPVVGGE